MWTDQQRAHLEIALVAYDIGESEEIFLSRSDSAVDAPRLLASAQRLVNQAQSVRTLAVVNARESGMSWSKVGKCVGTSARGARKLWSNARVAARDDRQSDALAHFVDHWSTARNQIRQTFRACFGYKPSGCGSADR